MSETYIDPSPEALEKFMQLPTDQTVDMLNMVRLRDVAEYAPDSPHYGSGKSGFDAYQTYLSEIAPIMQRVGAEIVYDGKPEVNLVGPSHERWDWILVMRYPNMAALGGLTMDAEYAVHAEHRKAAVMDFRVVRLSRPD